MSDFRIEVQNYNSETDDFVYIDVIYFSRHTIENLIRVKGDGSLKFGKVLDRRITLRKVTESQSVSANTQYYYQMALPSQRTTQYFRSRASAWIKSQPKTSSLRMTKPCPDDIEDEFCLRLRDTFVMPRENEQANLKPFFLIDSCYEFLEGILKTKIHQPLSADQDDVTGVSIVTLDKIGKVTDTCLEEVFSKENKQRVYVVYGNDKNTASAKKLLEDAINSNNVRKVLMLHNNGKDCMRTILRNFGSRLSYLTGDHSQIFSSFTNPVLNLTSGCLTYLNKDNDIVEDIRELVDTEIQATKLERKRLGD